MSILLDHCVPRRYLQLLRDWGYKVSLLGDHADVRAVDPDVLAVAQRLDAILLTIERDFGDITRYPPQEYDGIIVIHEEHRAHNAIANQLKEALQALYRDGLRGMLVVIKPDEYRTYPPQS